MTHELEHLFIPRSVAIIGISRSTPSLGRMILDNMKDSGFSGDIYLVNPKAKEIDNHTIYNNIEDIPTTIDLAVILTPPRFVPPTLKLLGEKECKFASIITAGFNEELTTEILSIASTENIRIIGPNSMGTFGKKAHVSFSPLPINDGSIGFISQSGSIVAVAQECLTDSFGFSSFISLGNKIDITELDALEYMAQDESTKVIVCYLESFANPGKLRELLSSITPNKPVIVVKGGRTEQGSRAVSSHTGALAGNYRLTASLLDYCGAILVPTIEEAMDVARFISRFGISPHTGVVTISSAGGPGVLAADEIVEAGLTLAKLQQDNIEKLEEVIPTFGNANNPLDLVADAGVDRYIDTIEIIKDDPAVTTLLVIIVHPVLIDTDPLLEAMNKLDIPIICAYLGPEFSTFDNYENLILYQKTEDVISILAHINAYWEWRQNASKFLELPAVQEKKHTNHDDNVVELLQSYDFVYPESHTTNSLTDAMAWFASQDQAVVMKLDHPQFSHKTDTGGVILDIKGSEKFEEAWKNLVNIYNQHNIDQEEQMIEIQPFYTSGVEMVLGIIKDEQFGHFILIGAGGTFVEFLNDTVFLPSPVSRYAVRKGIESLKFNQLLQGYRGSNEVDLDLLVEEVLKLDQLAIDHPDIIELDINPLYILPDRNEFVVLDARMDTE